MLLPVVQGPIHKILIPFEIQNGSHQHCPKMERKPKNLHKTEEMKQCDVSLKVCCKETAGDSVSSLSLVASVDHP